MGIFDNINTSGGGTSLFSGIGGTATTTAQQPSGGLFGTTQNKPSFGFGQSTAQPAQQTTGGGLFGNSTQQNPGGGLFGASAQQPQQPQQAAGGLFGSTTQQSQQAGGMFGQSQHQQQQQQQQQLQQGQRPLDQTLRFGFGDSQQTLTQSQQGKEPWWQEGRGMGVLRSIPQQMALLKDKWDPASLNSPLRTYLYQHVGSESEALKYGPSPDEDPSKWEEAVQNRPGPEWVPVLARGFQELGRRAMRQREAIAHCNMMLTEINNSLDIQLDTHRQKVAARLAESKRRHKEIGQRTLSLAVKVQMLKNRGYVMDNAEEELKSKLTALEKEVLDPAVHAREQEIWARMMGIRERARYLKSQMEKLEPVAQNDEPLLDDATLQKARKTLSDYDLQMQHLQKELKLVHEEYADWEKASRASGLDHSRIR